MPAFSTSNKLSKLQKYAGVDVIVNGSSGYRKPSTIAADRGIKSASAVVGNPSPWGQHSSRSLLPGIYDAASDQAILPNTNPPNSDAAGSGGNARLRQAGLRVNTDIALDTTVSDSGDSDDESRAKVRGVASSSLVSAAHSSSRTLGSLASSRHRIGDDDVQTIYPPSACVFVAK
jgi:hypothetical protein